MRTSAADYSATPASPGAALLRRTAVSIVASGVLTCAIVLAQDTKPAPASPRTAGGTSVITETVVIKQAEVKEAQNAGVPLKVRLQPRKAVVAADGNVNPMIEQFAQQGRPIVRAELLFVRHICKLNPEQLRPISREAGQALRDVARKMVEHQQNGVRLRAGGQAGTTIDAGKMLQDRLAPVFEKHLSPEQYALYRSEVDKRAANRKQAALRFLVEVLDRDLVLSGQQREKLTESLSAHWDDGWCLYMEYILHGNQFCPTGLDQLVTPLLNGHQKKIWQGVQKVQGFWGFGNVMGGMANGNDPSLRDIGLEEDAEPNAALRAKELRLNGGAIRGQMKKEAAFPK